MACPAKARLLRPSPRYRGQMGDQYMIGIQTGQLPTVASDKRISGTQSSSIGAMADSWQSLGMCAAQSHRGVLTSEGTPQDPPR